MSRKKVLRVNIKLIRDKLQRAGITKKFLALVFKKPSGYIEDRLKGEKEFNYSELLSIADLTGNEIRDFTL